MGFVFMGCNIISDTNGFLKQVDEQVHAEAQITIHYRTITATGGVIVPEKTAILDQITWSSMSTRATSGKL